MLIDLKFVSGKIYSIDGKIIADTPFFAMPVDCCTCHAIYKIVLTERDTGGVSTGMCPECYQTWESKRAQGNLKPVF